MYIYAIGADFINGLLRALGRVCNHIFQQLCQRWALFLEMFGNFNASFSYDKIVNAVNSYASAWVLLALTHSYHPLCWKYPRSAAAEAAAVRAAAL